MKERFFLIFLALATLFAIASGLTDDTKRIIVFIMLSGFFGVVSLFLVWAAIDNDEEKS